MFNLDDEEVTKELLSYKYIGTKSASVVMGWCLKRNPFTVDNLPTFIGSLDYGDGDLKMPLGKRLSHI
jgi:hypothetical protein